MFGKHNAGKARQLGTALSAQLLWSFLRFGKPSNHRKLAVFKPDGIGDFVLSSEAIHHLVKEYKPDDVSLIVANEVKDLAAIIFPRVQIHPIVPGHMTWQAKIQGLGALKSAVASATYDTIVCLRHYRTLYEDTILRALHGNRVVLLANQSAAAQDPDSRTPVNFKLIQPDYSSAHGDALGTPREWFFHSEVLSQAIGKKTSPQALTPDWDCHKPKQAKDAFLLVAPFAGRHIRDIPFNLVEAASLEARAAGLKQVILTGSAKQAGRLETYAKRLTSVLGDCRVAIQHPSDLSALVKLVANSALVLTAETSTAHIAAALDQRAVVLIGGGHFGWFAPWSRSAKQIWLTNRLPCFGCNWKCIFPTPICLTEIKAMEIQRAVLTSLGNQS